jgi:hypothetical protein
MLHCLTRLLLPLLFFLTASLSFGQTLQISADRIDGNGLNYAKVIGQDENGVFLLMSNLSLESRRDRFGLRTRKYELSYYDYSLQRKWSKELSADPSSGTLENVSYFNNTVVVVTSDEDRSKGEVSLYISVIDAKGASSVSRKRIYSTPSPRGSEMLKPFIMISPDKSKLGVMTEEVTDDLVRIHLSVINDRFEPLRESKAEMSYDSREAELKSFSLSNNYDLLFLGYVKETRPNGDKTKLRRFRLFHLPPGKNRFDEHIVNTFDQVMLEAGMAIDKVNNKAIVTGFFSDKSSFAGASLLYAVLDLNHHDQFEIYTTNLNGEAQLKLVGQRNSGDGVSLFSYPIQRVIPRMDGGSLVIAEAAYLSEYSFYDYFTQTFNRRIEYHFDNVVALSVNAKGNVQWAHLLKKSQTSLDDEGMYSSFSTLLNPEELVILYNGEIGRSNEIMTMIINANGKSESKKINRGNDVISVLPRSGKQVDENTLIVPAVTRKRLFLVKIEI